MSRPQVDKNYTDMWVNQQFTEEHVEKYGIKFKNKWEKNIKHIQQIKFIKPYLVEGLYWCDFPIGSGRLEDELSSSKMLGLDISDAFLEFNRAKGRNCEKADLLNHDYEDEFDLVTSMHTVAAFSACDEILKGYIKSLKKGGLLIVDVANEFDYPVNQPRAYTKEEIKRFTEMMNCELLEAQYHDFWDHPRIADWRAKNTRFRRELWWLINRLYFSKFKIISKSTFLVLNGIEKLFGKQFFCKILVVMRKK